MRYWVLLLSSLLASCTLIPPENVASVEKKEQIVGAFSTPEGKFYLLGNEMDYEVVSTKVAYMQWLLPLPAYSETYWSTWIPEDEKTASLFGRVRLMKRDFVAPTQHFSISQYHILCQDLPKELALREPECTARKKEDWPYVAGGVEVEVGELGNESLIPVHLVNRAAILPKATWKKPIDLNLNLIVSQSGLRLATEPARNVLPLNQVNEPNWTPFKR